MGLDSKDFLGMSGNEIRDTDEVSSFAISEALHLSPQQQEQRDKLIYSAVVAPTDGIVKRLQTDAGHIWDTESFQRGLSRQLNSANPAFIYRETAYIRSDIIPQDLVPIALEHEVIEILHRDEQASRIAQAHISKLGIQDLIGNVADQRPKHVIAMLHEAATAQKLGKEQEWMMFIRKMAAEEGKKLSPTSKGSPESEIRIRETMGKLVAKK